MYATVRGYISSFIMYWFFFLCESFCGAGMSQIFLSYRVAGEDLMIKGIETYNKHQLSLP